jgi:hypothetical protein
MITFDRQARYGLGLKKRLDFQKIVLFGSFFASFFQRAFRSGDTFEPAGPKGRDSRRTVKMKARRIFRT